jgi:cysteine desulfurase
MQKEKKIPRVYLDHNASTPLDPEVKNALIEELEAFDANPSSIHAFGQEVRNRVTKARRTIASFLNVRPHDLIFTSGGTESLNTALFGLTSKRGHIITSSVEHACVISICEELERRGFTVTYLHPGEYGAVTPEAVVEAIQPDTVLITLMAANNETGVKTDIEGISEIAERRSIPFVVDAVSLMGKEPFVIPEGVTAMAFSGHKFHALKGAGLLYVKTGTDLAPLIIGGGQESGRRGGTENVLGIISLAKAIEILHQGQATFSFRMEKLRNKLEEGLKAQLHDVIVNGKGPRIPNTTNLSFPGVDGESLLLNLDLAGIAVSHGSACSSGALEPSRVLLNMGTPKEIANTSIRFSLSRFTTEKEIDRCIEVVTDTVEKLKTLFKTSH